MVCSFQHCKNNFPDSFLIWWLVLQIFWSVTGKPWTNLWQMGDGWAMIKHTEVIWRRCFRVRPKSVFSTGFNIAPVRYVGDANHGGNITDWTSQNACLKFVWCLYTHNQGMITLLLRNGKHVVSLKLEKWLTWPIRCDARNPPWEPPRTAILAGSANPDCITSSSAASTSATSCHMLKKLSNW
jgi:hypothetical protein